MKHIKQVSKATPAQATVIQEIICQINQVLVDLLASFGASSPLLSFMAGKCDLPET